MVPAAVVNTTIEKHYYGAREPEIAWSRARSAVELGYPAFVHLHLYGTQCLSGCASRVVPQNPR
jgi:hypothetical protein